MKKNSILLGIIVYLSCCGSVAYADNWNNLTNPTDVPPKEIVNDMAKVAIGVTIVGAAILIAGKRGSDITADFKVTDATHDKPGSVLINFSGGTGPYTVTGIHPPGKYGLNSTGNSATISDLKAGDYEISFQDSKGNTFTAKTTVGGDKEISNAGANPGDSL